MSNSLIVADRSRIETWEFCPRARWWGYEWEGIGITRTQLSIDLEVGITTHEILHKIMAMAKANTFTEAELVRVQQFELASFETKIRQRGLAMELASGWEQQEDGTIAVQEGNLEFIIKLYRTWMQASTTAWTAVRLPHYIQNYEIVNCEIEEELYLGEGEVLFMSRPDALLKRYADGELFVLNFKTVGEANKWWLDQWPIDMQTLTENLPVEARLGQKVSGVIIEGLVKGGKKLQYPPGSGSWYINSPLAWMWKKDSAPPFPAEYACRYEWTGDDGKGHRLGKGWHKQPVWEDELGVQGWLNWLHENDPELLRSQFVDLPPILRSDYAVESWQRKTLAQEVSIRDRREAVNYGTLSLDAGFPMHTAKGNCVRPSTCEFYKMCHGTAATDPLDNGYQVRVPNHPQEAQLVQIATQEDQ